MPRLTHVALALLALTISGPALPSHAQAADNPYTIMRPEPGHPEELPQPWLPPRYHSPRGTKQHVTPPRREPPVPAPRAARVPPPIVSPETGRLLPNLPNPAPSGPNGTETFQDRAARCAHQAGVYGSEAGNRNAYIGTCVNQ